MKVKYTKEQTIELAHKASQGDNESFKELEEIAKPLLYFMAQKFSSMHHKFEYEDFYSICRYSLYESCCKFSYNGNVKNPSFLSFAKLIIERACWREVRHWNADRRNPFDNSEVSLDDLIENTNFDVTDENSRTRNGISAELRRDLVNAIQSLPNKRDAFVLYAYTYEDKSVEEISKVIGTKPKYIYQILNKARKELAVLAVLD